MIDAAALAARRHAKCIDCGGSYAPAELLVVVDLLTGSAFHVCRPEAARAWPGRCFRDGVGPRDRFAIALAGDAAIR
jgi:hypothetical protein